jgi:V/A-type H+-transporting ATPase subunit E
MEGIEKITARIAQDANNEIAQLNEQTQSQVQAIRAQAQEQADKTSADILAKGQKAAQERLERLESAAGMERRKLELAAKQEVLDEAFDLALQKLCDLPEKDYVQLLTNLAAEASTNGQEQLVFSQKDRAQVGKKVVVAANKAIEGGHLKLSEETRPMKGGFILVDGDVEINCAFETLVRLQREKLEKEVSKALFD